MNPKAETLGSLNRALDVLEAFDNEHRTWGLTALARELGLGKPTLHRLLRNLEVRGYVRQDPESKLYRLGFRTIKIGQAALVETPNELVMPYLRELTRSLGEQSTLWVPDGLEAVCVAKVPGTRRLRAHTDLGAREPAVLLASGRCLLAHYRGNLEELLGSKYADLRRVLQRIRKTGYEISYGDRWPDMCAVAAPVFDHDGHNKGAIAFSAATSRINADMLTETVHAVREAGMNVSTAMGAPDEVLRVFTSVAPDVHRHLRRKQASTSKASRPPR
ncbi:IclR family transcriptional regulator [Qaidamihabitans albus]|uniref:IclR family transcriptional regulator n=1 Tax=Qaidamihabitans albus TaxID=2795733 RepID=UPI0018F1A6C0|nr:IclR family transcriptional regulator [Qaidamihabitans albus]